MERKSYEIMKTDITPASVEIPEFITAMFKAGKCMNSGVKCLWSFIFIDEAGFSSCSLHNREQF